MDALNAMRFPSVVPGGIAGPAIQPFQPPKITTQELQNLGSVGQAQHLQPGRGFSDYLSDMVRDVNAKQANAGATVESVLAGESVPLHQAMIAVEEASVSFQLMVEVRNKLLESYQELMRMQI